MGDVVEAYLRTLDVALSDPGAIYNICSGRQMTLRATVDAARSALSISAGAPLERDGFAELGHERLGR